MTDDTGSTGADNEEVIEDEDEIVEPQECEGQQAFFALTPEWQREWEGMPEFVQNNNMPWKTLLVHFTCREDMLIFQDLIQQRFSKETKYVWFPEAEIGRAAHLRWAEEEQASS